MEATAKIANQPQVATQMKVMNIGDANHSNPQQEHCEHKKASHLRGGGAGKECFLGLIGCFLCFECCEGCCDCVGDIICCPCEMCC